MCFVGYIGSIYGNLCWLAYWRTAQFKSYLVILLNSSFFPFAKRTCFEEEHYFADDLYYWMHWTAGLYQCDQMVRLFWPLATIKLAQKCTKFAKVRSTFYQIRNKLSKICKRAKFCQIRSHWPLLTLFLPFACLLPKALPHTLLTPNRKLFSWLDNRSFAQ